MRIFATAFCAALCAAPVAAQQPCLGSADFYASLEQQGAYQISYGVVHEGLVMETWADTDSGEWIVFVTRPDGISCIVAGGEGFQLTAEARGTL